MTTWIDLEVLLNEIKQTEKDKYSMISLICGIWKPKQMNKDNKTKTELQIQGMNSGLPVGKGEKLKERSRWGRLRNINFQLQSKWVRVWNIQCGEYSQ